MVRMLNTRKRRIACILAGTLLAQIVCYLVVRERCQFVETHERHDGTITTQRFVHMPRRQSRMGLRDVVYLVLLPCGKVDEFLTGTIYCEDPGFFH